jgi:gamma-glutamylcyclotransferase (GGCT)/AIG2-like uncharacterized protein YtfP
MPKKKASPKRKPATRSRAKSSVVTRIVKTVKKTVTSATRSVKKTATTASKKASKTAAWLDRATESRPAQGQRLFVYGTLRQKQYAHRQLRGASFDTDAEVPGYHRVQRANGPAIIKGQGAVRGEVYRVDNATLQRLDAYEANYRREQVRLDDGTYAWAYVWKD